MNNLIKYHYLVFLLLFVGLESYSQSKEIDSLKQLIKTVKYDTTRIRLYNDLGIAYWYINTDKSIEVANTAIVLANGIKYYKQLARSYNVIGGAYKINNDIVAAYRNCKKSFKIANQLGLEKDLVNSIVNISGVYAMGVEIENKEIEQYCDKLILLSKNEYIDKIIYSFLAIYDRRNFSANFFDLIKYIESVNIDKTNELYPIFCLLKAHDFEYRNKYFDALYYINLCQEDNINPLIEIVANNTKANILYALQRYNEAEVVCELLIKKYKKSNEKATRAVLFITNDILIAVYTKNHKYKNGYDLITDQLKTNTYMSGADLEFNANSAHIYYGLDSIHKAIKITDNVLTVSKNVENYNAYADMLCLKISILGNQGKNIETFKCIKDLESIPFDKIHIRSQFDVFSVLSKYFKTHKHFDKTSLYLEKLLNVQDSLNKREVISIIEEEKVKYEVEKQQQQIVTQQKDIKNKNIQIGFGLAIITLSLTLIFVILKYQLNMRKVQIEKQLSLENELQLRTLHSKVLPHFTKNVLTAIGHFAMDDNRKAGKYIAMFSKFTQLTLANSDKNYNTLEEELNYIQTYLDLEKMRFGDKFSFQIDVDSKANKNTIFVPSMALHTYCDNAIRHGIVNNEGDGELKIVVKKTADGTLISVSDNGIGRKRSAELATHGNQMGLKLVQQQLDFYNQINEHHITQTIIDLHDEKGNALGTQIELFIPDGYVFSSER